MVVKEKEGGNVNTAHIRREVDKVDIARPLSVDLITAMKNKKDAYNTFQKIKPKAAVYRKRFLYQSQREAYNKGLLDKAANIRALNKRE